MRNQIYSILEGPPSSRAARWVQGGILLLILLNVIAVALETIEPLGTTYSRQFRLFEWLSVTAFTLEYLTRLYACRVRTGGEISSRLRFALTPMAILDLLAIVPAYLPFFFGIDLRPLRAVRLLRSFRVLKLRRHARAVQSLGRAVSEKGAELVVTASALGIALVVGSTVLYFAEHGVQPAAFGSIPEAAWWGLVTLTTVGAANVAPITPLGQLAGAAVAVLGVGLVAVPAGLLAAAFIHQLVQQATKCPHCGREI
jgi:voltage-gated potassium channel